MTIGDRPFAINVDVDGVFETTEKDEKGFPILPIHAFAYIVGGKRDFGGLSAG